MGIAKILKNKKASPAAKITLKEPGVSIPIGPSGTYTISPEEYALWTTIDVINEITSHINSGDIVVNDGTRDLTAAEGLRYLEKVETVDIQLNGNDITKSPVKLNFLGDVTVQNIAGGEARVAIGETGQFPGKMFEYTYISNGSAYNKWLEADSSSAPSNEVPRVSPFDANVVAYSYSNAYDDSEIDAEIYVNGTLADTWQIRNKRNAYKTNISLYSINMGDRISIFFKQVSGGTPGAQRPQTPILKLYSVATSVTLQEGGEQYGD